MSSYSLIYKHIWVYRLIMNILYLGKYQQRFKPIQEEVKKFPHNSSVLELCFGDTAMATFCREAGYTWTGIDVNEHFVKQAQKSGFDAHLGDLTSQEALPKADICIMIGSLYHFHPNTESLLSRMFRASNCVILSEPVANLSSQKGLIGFLARKSANAGKGDEKFRYNETTFLAMLNQYCEKFNCKIVSLHPLGKDLMVKLIKK